MTVQPLTGALIGLALLQVLVIMICWHGVTRGHWRRFPAGRVLMWLLAVIGAILTLATASSFWPVFPGRAGAYIALYVALNVVLSALGVTIIREQRRHQRDHRDPPDKEH